MRKLLPMIFGGVSAAFLVLGCCKQSSDVADGDDWEKLPTPSTAVAPTTETPPAATAPAATASTPAGVGTDPKRPGRGLDGLPAEIPRPSSKPPTVAEWNEMPWEITVGRSTPLACETKMVREWLRVSCRDKNKWGGEIKGMKIVNKGGVQAYTAERKGLASLVVQVVRGKKHVSRFRWTDRVQTLVVDWSARGHRPKITFTD